MTSLSCCVLLVGMKQLYTSVCLSISLTVMLLVTLLLSGLLGATFGRISDLVILLNRRKCCIKALSTDQPINIVSEVSDGVVDPLHCFMGIQSA